MGDWLTCWVRAVVDWVTVAVAAGVISFVTDWLGGVVRSVGDWLTGWVGAMVDWVAMTVAAGVFMTDWLGGMVRSVSNRFATGVV